MELTRRKFLQLSGISALGAVIFNGCSIPEEELQVQSPLEIPEDVVAGGEAWYATLCRQCSSVDGILVRVMEGRAKKVEGNPDYPLNLGKHTARCEAALQDLYHPDRIQQPYRLVGPRGSGEFEPISWEEALDTLVQQMNRTAGDPNKMLMITDPLRGHLGMVTDRFAKTYGASRVEFEPMERLVLRRAISDVYGQDRIPYFDIKNTKYLLSFGADFLGTWVSPLSHAVAYGEFRQGSGRTRGTMVQVEPRFSMTAISADYWIPVKPGTEGLLALGIARVMISDSELASHLDGEAVTAFTGGAGAAVLNDYTPESVASETGLTGYYGEEAAVKKIHDLARGFATNRPSLAIGGDSAAASTNGLFNLSAIYALNYLVGSVGVDGGVQFNPPSPIEGIPDAATGASLTDWQGIASRLENGLVSLVVTRGANPVHGLPGAINFQSVLLNAGFIVSFASVMDDTSALADLILPEHAAMEAWGDDLPDPGPGYQVVGFQQPVVRPVYDTRAFGDVLLAIAPEISNDLADALPWNTMQDVIKDGARRLFEMNRGSIKAPNFDSFWSGILQRGGWWDVNATSRETVSTGPKLTNEIKRPSFAGSESEYPFHLIPFRSLGLLDGRNAHLPWLQATPDPTTTGVWDTWVEINQKEAIKLEIMEGDVLLLESPSGSIEVIAYPSPAAPPNVLSVPVGQGHTTFGRYAENRGANPIRVLALEKDEVGGLAWAATRVRIKKTNRRARMVKFEGMVPAIQMEEMPVIQVTSH
jgi:anaerobic selenocysteine-containing dehydrogenase